MGGLSLDDLMSSSDGGGHEGGLEPESRQRGRVVALRRDEVFVEFGGREQGCVPARSFETPPQPGDTIEVIVQRFNAEEGLYDLTLPGMSVELGNWDEVHEGMLVDAQITGHNTGGLECEVNHIRGFIPVSQISLVSRGRPGPIRRPALRLLDHRRQSRAEEPRAQPPGRAGTREGREEAGLPRVARSRPDLRRHGAKADGFRGLRRVGQRGRWLVAHQPVVLGPHQASQRGCAGRSADPRPHREDTTAKPAASAFPIAR